MVPLGKSEDKERERKWRSISVGAVADRGAPRWQVKKGEQYFHGAGERKELKKKNPQVGLELGTSPWKATV